MTGGRQVVVGEMCPQGAAGRPAVAPLMMRTVAVDRRRQRGRRPRSSAAASRGSWSIGVDGKIAGAFDTVGIADIGLQQPVASGTYVGASPCTADAGKGARSEEPRCGPATSGCGLAIGELARPDDPPTTPAFTTGGACLSGDAIAVDIDGDGVIESFPLASVLDRRSAARPTEWSAAPTAGAPCTPTFQLYDIRLVRPPEPGKPIDTKSIVMLDVLGVLDLDGDGRKEVVTRAPVPDRPDHPRLHHDRVGAAARARRRGPVVSAVGVPPGRQRGWRPADVRVVAEVGPSLELQRVRRWNRRCNTGGS